MDVLKSYAHQVVSYHPEQVRDELFAEIYDELCEEYDDWREQNPGAAAADFLNACKEHPVKYATRLASEGSTYLVGPQFYFSFISALKTGAVITAAVYLLLAVVSAIGSGQYWGSFWRVLTGIPETLLWVGAVILGVFIAMEKSGERASWLDNWKASDLKPLDGHQQISKAETFFDLGLSTFALLWLTDIIHLPAMIRHDGEWIAGWTVLLPTWFWIAAAALLAFDIGFCVLRLMRGFWSKALRMTTIVANLLWMFILLYAVAQPQLLSVDAPVPAEILKLLPMANRALDGLLVVICLILAWEILTHTWRLVRK